MEIYGMKPVNKSAALVTDQSGCSDSFLLDMDEQLRVICKRKMHFQELCRSLSLEIGIDARGGRGTGRKFPRRILRHPQFRTYMGVREELTKIDAQIVELKDEIKKLKPNKAAPARVRCDPEKFEQLFFDIIKVKYPMIYKEIKEEIYSRGETS